MGICPNCGSWVDEGDICHGCGGSGSYSSQNDENEQYDDYSGSETEKLSRKAWELYRDAKYENALHYINMALDLNSRHVENWNKKAIILEYLERFEESEQCYNKSLRFCRRDLVCDNKARMLLKWAGNLFDDAKKLSDGLAKLEESLEITKRAIDALPENTEENMDNFTGLKHSIESAIGCEKEYLKNIETLKTYDKSELFTIVGTRHYNIGKPLTPGMSLKLVKEPDNEFDKDAIAVYVEDKKAGYVANTDYTNNELTSSASELQDKIKNTAEGEYLIYLLKYTNPEYYNIDFHIGRII